MRSVLISAFLLLATACTAQVSFKTVVPREPVVTGTSFQVQYVLEGWDRQFVIKPSSFDHFRFVTGPYNYPGSVPGRDGAKPVRNTVYTLEAGEPGVYTIRGATAILEGQPVKSNDVTVHVISKQEAAERQLKDNGVNPDYVLSPGENAQEKIRKNLFVKVWVDKKNCYTGEPVLAVFKLYSRLQSRSDIVKNPGFYGFTIYDVVNLEDKVTATETVNGKLFDVHIIRKVQLYPLQPGIFSIDPMEIVNKVEFSKSAVRKRTEQQIAEGMLGGNEESEPAEGTTVVESSLSTEPVQITVKPVPEKIKPAGYSGAVGRFSINASVEKNELAKNEEGFLSITISGKGNFIQLDAPAVQWPAGIEGFAPVVTDSLDKTTTPLTGTRKFRYAFVCTAPGTYVMPSVSFSYFDTDSNKFQTRSAGTVTVTGTNIEQKKEIRKEDGKVSLAYQSEKKDRIALLLVVAVVLVVLLYYGFRKKEKTVLPADIPATVLPGPVELLSPAFDQLEATPGTFYQSLHTCIWQFLQQKLGLSAGIVNKQAVETKLTAAGIAQEDSAALLQVIALCETGMYTTADPCEDKMAMYQQTLQLLEGMEKKQ